MMPLRKVYGSKALNKPVLWMVNVWWLLLGVLMAFVLYASAPQFKGLLPVWAPLCVLPALLFSVRIQFVKTKDSVVANFIYFWAFIPYRRYSQEVVGLAATCSSDDLEEEDELVLGGGGKKTRLEVSNLYHTVDWIVGSTGLPAPLLRRDYES